MQFCYKHQIVPVFIAIELSVTFLCLAEAVTPIEKRKAAVKLALFEISTINSFTPQLNPLSLLAFLSF